MAERTDLTAETPTAGAGKSLLSAPRHESEAANQSEACNLFTQVDVIAVDLSISVALFQIQFVLPRIERSEVRTCLD
jgi:hypothetical protein